MGIHQLLQSKDIGTIYAQTNDLESVERIGKPKLTLYFLEDSNYNKQSPKKMLLKVLEGQKELLELD